MCSITRPPEVRVVALTSLKAGASTSIRETRRSRVTSNCGCIVKGRASVLGRQSDASTPYASYAAPRRGGQVVQTEASIGSHSGSIPDPAAFISLLTPLTVSLPFDSCVPRSGGLDRADHA